jgi:hypothetical protein
VPPTPTTQGRLEIHRRHSVAKSRSWLRTQPSEPVDRFGSWVIRRVLWLSGAVEKGSRSSPETPCSRSSVRGQSSTFDSSLKTQCLAEHAASHQRVGARPSWRTHRDPNPKPDRLLSLVSPNAVPNRETTPVAGSHRMRFDMVSPVVQEVCGIRRLWARSVIRVGAGAAGLVCGSLGPGRCRGGRGRLSVRLWSRCLQG